MLKPLNYERFCFDKILFMEIRAADLKDKAEIIALYERSQFATSLPNPALIPPAELGQRLYDRQAIERFVAIEGGRIVGHAMIEEPNSEHEEIWRQALDNTCDALVEMGAAFVEPALSGQGIWSSLLLHRIILIRKAGAHPVTATWDTNEHVKRTFKSYGGINAGRQTTPLGEVALFVFQLR
jgi:GNAT superfamily N-acetyltransferase